MAEAKSQKEIDKYMALLQAGFGMLGGTSRIAAENIGRGAILGSQAYQEAAHLKEVRRGLIRSLLVIAYFLMCYFLPRIFGGQRSSLCRFNMLKANNFFAFLLVGLTALTFTINLTIFYCTKGR
jgi:hypothetical protein